MLIRKSFSVAILIAGFAVTYGQTPDACPAISITGPTGVTKPGDTLNFDVTLSPEKYDQIRYQWFVSAGTIVKGQGKPWIVVQTENGVNGQVTATVEISGLPNFCSASATETATVFGGGDPIVIDEFPRTTPLREQIRRFQEAAKEAQENDQILTVAEYFRTGSSAAAIRKRTKWISDQLLRLGKLQLSDFRIVTSVFADSPPQTRIYRVPRDSNPFP